MMDNMLDAIAETINRKFWAYKKKNGTFEIEIDADNRDEMDDDTAGMICQSDDPALALLEKMNEL